MLDPVTPEQALALLCDAKKLEVELVRRGKPLVLTYVIKG